MCEKKSEPAKSWCYTLNNPTDTELCQLIAFEARKHRAALEVGEGGTKHVQGFITWLRAYRLGQLAKLVPRAHWEVARCIDAANYCTKGEIIIDVDNHKRGKEKETVTQQVWAAVAAGESKADFASRGPSLPAMKHFALAREWAADKPRECPPEVHWRWGPAGSGKTRWAYDNFPASDVWVSSEAAYFTGYENQRVAILDEVRPGKGSFTDEQLLRLLDRYPMVVRTFYGVRQWNSAVIVVTSPYHPRSWGTVGGTDCIAKQLERRCTTITRCGEEEEVPLPCPAGAPPVPHIGEHPESGDPKTGEAVTVTVTTEPEGNTELARQTNAE